MKFIKKIGIGLICIIILMFSAFFAGRYGWKIFGFALCESAGIEQIEAREDGVYIRGFCPGSFPEGFLGYFSEQKNGTLYIGFKFSGIFGFFEKGDFEITVPTGEHVSRIMLKTGSDEYCLWQE